MFFYNRDFDNRAMGLLGASNGHSITALWLLSQLPLIGREYSLVHEKPNNNLTPGG